MRVEIRIKELEPNIPEALLLKLHKAVLLGRRFDERLLSLQIPLLSDWWIHQAMLVVFTFPALTLMWLMGTVLR